MNRKLWVIGLVALGYGVFGMFYYYPSFEYIDKPFPLEHSTMITPNPDGNGYKALRFADPVMSVKADPYWLGWSISFYSGISILVLFGLQSFVYKIRT